MTTVQKWRIHQWLQGIQDSESKMEVGVAIKSDMRDP